MPLLQWKVYWSLPNDPYMPRRQYDNVGGNLGPPTRVFGYPQTER
jgi:hypothetical protein